MSTNCLVTKLKSIVENDNLSKLGHYELSFGVNSQKIQMQIPSGIIKCIEGHIYRDNQGTVYANPGETVVLSAAGYFYIYEEPVAFEILNKYDIGKIDARAALLAKIIHIEDFAPMLKCNGIRFVNNKLIGNLESFVQDACLMGRSINITVEHQYVYFNSQNTHSKYFVDFTSDTTVVTVKDTDSSGTLLGSYNKTTKVWTYE